MCIISFDRVKYIVEELVDLFLYVDECNKGIFVGGMFLNIVYLGRYDI